MAITYMMITRTHKEIICSCGNHTITPHNQLGSTSYITLPGEKCPACGHPVDETLHAGRTFFSSRSKSQTVADPYITAIDHCSFSLHVTRYEFDNDDGYGKKDNDMRLSMKKKNEADLSFSAITPKETGLTMDGKVVPATKSNLGCQRRRRGCQPDQGAGVLFREPAAQHRLCRPGRPDEHLYPGPTGHLPAG